MLEFMNTKIADRITGVLAGTGPEGRAKKTLSRYRANPNDTDAAEALSLLNALDQNKRLEIKHAAGL